MHKPGLVTDIEFPFTSPEELETYLPYLITRLAHRWATDQDTALDEVGLQGAKMRVLASLSAFEELTINELSILSVTEQSTTSRTVEQLVTAGMVERKISSKDQRVRTVTLTDDGLTTLSGLAPTINDLYKNLISGVKKEDLQTCVDVLGRILHQVRKNEI